MDLIRKATSAFLVSLSNVNFTTIPSVPLVHMKNVRSLKTILIPRPYFSKYNPTCVFVPYLFIYSHCRSIHSIYTLGVVRYREAKYAIIVLNVSRHCDHLLSQGKLVGLTDHLWESLPNFKICLEYFFY